MKNKKNIYLLYIIALLQGMVFYGPIATLYRQANGLTIFQITLIESVSYILCILLEIPWGIIADKIGYKKTMCICCCLYLISKIIFWQAVVFFDFLLERIILSIVISGISGVDTSILYLSCNKGQSQKVFSVYNSLGLIGLLFASLVFSAFIGSNYPAAALLTVISYGVAAVLSLFLEEVKITNNQVMHLSNLKESFIQIIKDKKFILFLISVAFFTQTHQTITVFFSQIQYENCGMSTSVIGYVHIIVTLAGLFGMFSATLTRRIGKKHGGTMFQIAIIFSCIILVFANISADSVLGVLLLNVANSLYQPYQMELQNNNIISANRATELSVYAMIINCVSAGISILFGCLGNVNLKIGFFLGAWICLIGLIFFSTWYKAKNKS